MVYCIFYIYIRRESPGRIRADPDGPTKPLHRSPQTTQKGRPAVRRPSRAPSYFTPGRARRGSAPCRLRPGARCLLLLPSLLLPLLPLLLVLVLVLVVLLLLLCLVKLDPRIPHGLRR